MQKCAGLGDRVRGTPAIFYSAIMMERFFVLMHDKPVLLETFFHINSDWYHIDRQVFRAKLLEAQKQSNLLDYFPVFDTPAELVHFLKAPDDYDFFAIPRGLFYDMKLVFRHEKARYSLLANIFPEIRHSDMDTLNYRLLASVFYEISFRNLRSKFSRLKKELFDFHGITDERWKKALKIGVQIRLAPNITNWRDPGERAMPNQIHCFVKKTRSLIENSDASLYSGLPIVFVASDVTGSTDIVRKGLEGIAHVFDSTYLQQKYNISRTHIDKADYGHMKRNSAWYSAALTYVDFHILGGSALDMLVITRSGFGELPSKWSMAPTWLFAHWEKSGCKFVFNRKWWP